jgi:Trk-type K+ transport system membrane component
VKLKIALFSIVILSALFLSAFGSPATAQTVRYQDTAQPPAVTLVPPTVVVVTTPGVIPVTGNGDAPTGLWTLILFGLLGLLGIAFLVALFSPRTTVIERHDHLDGTPPHDHEV